jgi:hypothetical protein
MLTVLEVKTTDFMQRNGCSLILEASGCMVGVA